MATEAQVTANRSNAQKSTGPRTPEGKVILRNKGITNLYLKPASYSQI